MPWCLTAGTLRAMKAEGKIHDGVRTQVIRGEHKFAVGGDRGEPFTVPHDAAEPVQYVISDGAARLGVLTDIGISTRHVEQTLSGLDALVLECNYDRDMLWAGAYPRWLKERIAGPFGHLDNQQSARLLARARPLAPEARHRSPSFAAEQQARDRARGARRRAQLLRGLDRPRLAGRRLRLARNLEP